MAGRTLARKFFIHTDESMIEKSLQRSVIGMLVAGPDAASHISSTRPDLIRAYDGYAWLDPGEADARNHTLAVVEVG